MASFVDRKSVHPDMDQDLHKKTDEELVEVVKERCETLYHPTSSCRMAPLEQGGALDSQLRVYGVRNLRVCDASVFPKIVSGHTVSLAETSFVRVVLIDSFKAGAVFAVAERLADLLKAEYEGKEILI